MRTAADTSMMTWGLLTMPSPANSSTAMTLSSENRATDCAAAGAPQARTQTTTAENAEHAGHKHSRRSPRASRLSVRHAFECMCMSGVRRDAWQRGRQRADDLGMKLGTGAAPQLPQRVARRTRATVSARAGDRVVRVGHVDDAGGQRDFVAAQAVR